MNHTKDARRIGLVDVNGHNGFPKPCADADFGMAQGTG